MTDIDRNIRPILDRLNELNDGPDIPKNVRIMTDTFKKEWTETMDLCLRRAEFLERVSAELREYAESLSAGIDKIPTEIHECVKYDVNARNRASEKF